MKFRFETRYLILLFSLSFFFSCKKDDNPSLSTPEPALFEKVQGKWAADIELPRRISKPSGREFFQPSKKVQDIGNISSVEFFSDSSYILTFNQYYAITGKLSVKDSTSFELSTIGTVSDLKVVGDSISFNCTYYDIPMTVKAARVGTVAIDNNKKAILKNWQLTAEEDGADFFEDSHASPDNISFFFSPAGTFLLKYSAGNQSYAQAFEWSIFSSKENSFLLSFPYYTQDNYSYLKIIELTDSTLKLQLIYVSPEYDDNDNIIGHTEDIRYTLVLTAK
ncbi:MAG: hypothetical protein QM768_18365 [Agriterribacter sp.]